MGDVLSNVIGAPFSPYIIEQLKLRASLGSTNNRTNEQILYLANKMSWTKLSSFVNIKPAQEQPLSKFYANLFDGQTPPGDYSKPNSLAKNWILQAGTTEYNNGTYNLRYGLGPNNAYGLGGIEQQGYRPMPGLTSVTIDTKGTLGSLREATINFSVWNMTQLNVIEALYFRLGYTMLLEWGHVNYFDNNGQYITNPYGLDVFSYDSKEKINQAVTQRNIETYGNYDAMLGTVTNFFFSFNSQGGYDCNIKLIGLGSIIDTLRINQTFTMPNSLRNQVQQAEKQIEAKKAEELRLLDIKNREKDGKPGTILPVVTDLSSLKAIYESTAKFKASDDWAKSISFLSTQYVATTGTPSTDYYYKANGTSPAYNDELNNDPNNIGADRTGLFLNKNARRQKWQRIPANISPQNPQPVKLDLTLLNNLAVFDRQFYVSATSNSSTIKYKTELSDITLNVNSYLEPNKTLTYLDIAGAFDTALLQSNNSLYKLESNTPIPKVKDKGPANFTVVIPYAAGTEQKFYAFIVPLTQSSFYYTREEYINTFTLWFTSDGTVNIDGIQTATVLNQHDVVIHGTTQGLYIGTELIKAQFITNDPGLISEVLPRPPKTGSPTPQLGSTNDPQGNTVGQGNQTNSAQTEQKEKFNSSLHTMLNTVKTIGQAKGLGAADAVVPVDLIDITRIFFKSGILQNAIPGSLNKLQQEELTRGNLDSSLLGGVDFELTAYAKKGFNSNLMADKTNFYKIKDIEWDKLCTAYYVGYEFSDNGATITTGAEKPVYIKLGYLLAFLNNMCLLYESVSKKNNGEGNSQNTVKPYTYIDFHPDFNFCLTAPQHMTIDPSKCFIPLVCTNLEYEDLFNVNVKVAFDTPIFKPETSSRLSALKTFKTNNAYQGKTMEILLNTQFLLDLADRFIADDKTSALNLKPFLDTLMDEIGKSTGNFNLFRVAYRDDSNTIIIKDDQWTPNLQGEKSTIEKESYLANRQYMELQVFGSGSLVRDMEFKTNMNTKMSSMIAISAQSSGKQSANGIDASPIGIYNINYEDNIMQIKQDVNVDSAKETEEERKLEIINTNNEAAIKFNNYVESVYYGGRIPISQTSTAAKYYQDRLTELKARDITTTAAPFIPANLSITLDGISGIVMGNAFCIPESRLPASLRGGKGDFTKVGFAVVGLTHTLENNQWLTKIRGQMINLREINSTFAQTADIKSNINSFNYPSASGPIGKCKQLGCVRRNSNAYTAAPLYQNAQFRAGVDALTKKYQLKDPTALYKVMYAESRLDPNEVLKSTNATGLLQFLPKSAADIGTTVDIIKRTDGVGQLKFVEKYFDKYPAIKGGGVYEVYAAVFFPSLLKHLNDPNWIIQSTDYSAYIISYQNTPIACSAGKQPGEALTVSDFKKYVDCIS